MSVLNKNILVSVGTTAKLLGVTPWQVKRWCELGKLRVTITEGGHRRYSLAEVEALRQSAEFFSLIAELSKSGRAECSRHPAVG